MSLKLYSVVEPLDSGSIVGKEVIVTDEYILALNTAVELIKAKIDSAALLITWNNGIASKCSLFVSEKSEELNKDSYPMISRDYTKQWYTIVEYDQAIMNQPKDIIY